MSGFQTLTGAELRDIRKKLNLSQEQFGALCGASRGTVSDWERAKYEVPLLVARVMRLLAEEPLTLYKLWPTAPGGEQVAASPAQQEEEPPAEANGAGVGTAAAETKRTPVATKGEASQADKDALAAETARRFKLAQAALAKSGRRRK